jgi:hypothetical protein
MRGGGKLRIDLLDQLRAGSVKRLVIKTRRSFTKPGDRRLSLTGYSLTGAREQSGFIGITQSTNLWVSAVTSQGLHPIDIGKLPIDLRTRAATSHAFEFLDQPFRLDLSVEPSPALVKAESKTIFRIDPDRARNETTIEFEWVRGRLSELELGVPAGLQLLSVGPPEMVESSHVTDEAHTRDIGGSRVPVKLLRVRLTSLGRDHDKVTLKLTGLQRVPKEGRALLGLFAPLQAATASASYALLAERSLALDIGDDSGTVRKSADNASDASRSKTSWPWTSLGTQPSVNPLVLFDDRNSPFLPILITRHERTITQDTVLSAQVSKRSVDVLQRTNLNVRYGVANALEIRVPAGIVDRWEVLDKELVERRELGRQPDGARHFRLSFARPIDDATTLRFRYRLPLGAGLEAAATRVVALPWIIVIDVPLGPAKVELSLMPDIVIDSTDPAWIRSLDDDRAEKASDGAGISFAESDPSCRARPFTFEARALEPVSLPSLVIPRLLLKSALGGDDSLRTTALYWVESHGPDFAVALPEKAVWLGARVDGRTAERVDHDPSRGSYLVQFPGDVGPRPVIVELEYQQSDTLASSKWQVPRLLDGAMVLQSLWEIRLPSSFALLGVPRGWTDENEWRWNSYMWKRRPRRNNSGGNAWVMETGAKSRSVDDVDQANFDDSDRYVFSRVGQPLAISAWIVSRSWLVGICSGATLFIGFLAIFSKLRFRTIWVAIALLGLMAGVIVQPSLLFVALESAFLGAVLLLLGLLIERSIERSRFLSVSLRGGVLSAGRANTDSSLNRSPTVGSDDPTAVRVRVPSTLDFLPAPIAAPEPSDVPQSSTSELV